MNDQDKIAEQAAEIATLNKVISHLKAEITKLMGEAARAGIAGVVAPSVPAPVASNEQQKYTTELLAELRRWAGDDALYASRMIRSAADEIERLTIPAPVDTPEQVTFESRPMKERVLRNELAIIIGCADGRSGAEKADAALIWIERNGKYVFAPASVPQPTDAAAFKNFHRALCDRFNYTHDEQFWWRDQVSLIEHIAASVPQLAVQNGYKLVPIEPTDAICRAGRDCGIDTPWSYAACYRAMIAAAPDAAPLPELTGQSLTQAARLMLRDAANKLVNCGSIYDADKNKLIAELRGLADAASPSLAPAKQQEPGYSDSLADRVFNLPCRWKGDPALESAILMGHTMACEQAYDLVMAHEQSRVGGIASKASVETAAPGASTEDKQ